MLVLTRKLQERVYLTTSDGLITVTLLKIHSDGHQVLDYLKIIGVKAWRTNAGVLSAEYKGKRRYVRFSGAEGVSDVLGVMPPEGRFIAVETKRIGGKLTDKQRRFLDAIQDAGGLALCVSSVQDLETALKAEGIVS